MAEEASRTILQAIEENNPDMFSDDVEMGGALEAAIPEKNLPVAVHTNNTGMYFFSLIRTKRILICSVFPLQFHVLSAI